MCGIGGAVGEARVDAQKLLDALRHRGPSGEGTLDEGNGDARVLLVHTRLAILDLSPAGAQPMASASGRTVLAYNGEIYNFHELATELEARGVVLRSRSDTEVLVEGFERDGLAFVERCRGMFAFAAWERGERTLTLVRDRLGIKPLYVATPAGGRGLAFASELRALQRSGACSSKIDPAGLASYLAYGAVRGPTTLCADAELLEAGSYLRWRAGTIERGTWWRLPDTTRPDRPDAHEVVWRTRELLEQSVRLRLVSDVPVAVLLSGGIDSAAVATLAARALSPARVSTFSVTLDRENRDMDEGDRARALATRIGADHHEVPLRSSEIVGGIDAALAAMDQPTIDGVNTFFVSQAIHRAGVIVALSGLGGDEVFLGYPGAHSLRRDLAIARAARLPLALAGPGLRFAARALAARTPLAIAKLWALPDALPEVEALVDLRRTLFASPMRRALARGLPDAPHTPTRAGDAHLRWSSAELSGYLRNMLLRDTDVFAMRHPVEVRVPLIDHVLVEYVLSLPSELRARPGRQKPLLIDAMGLDLPADLESRPKTGFVLPFARWLTGPLRERVTEALHDRAHLESLGLDASAVARTWASFLARPSPTTWTRPWSLYTLSQWGRS